MIFRRLSVKERAASVRELDYSHSETDSYSTSPILMRIFFKRVQNGQVPPSQFLAQVSHVSESKARAAEGTLK